MEVSGQLYAPGQFTLGERTSVPNGFARANTDMFHKILLAISDNTNCNDTAKHTSRFVNKCSAYARLPTKYITRRYWNRIRVRCSIIVDFKNRVWHSSSAADRDNGNMQTLVFTGRKKINAYECHDRSSQAKKTGPLRQIQHPDSCSCILTCETKYSITALILSKFSQRPMTPPHSQWAPHYLTWLRNWSLMCLCTFIKLLSQFINYR